MPEHQRKEYLLRLAKGRRAIEAGQLDASAKEIALYQLNPPGKATIQDFFSRFGVKDPFVDEITPEERKRGREFIQEYLDVADTLDLSNAPMYGLLAWFLLMLGADEAATEEEGDAWFDAWCLKYGHNFPDLRGVQERLKALGGSGLPQ